MGKSSTSPERESKEPKAPQVRSSGRIIKRPKRDLTPPPPPSPPKKAKTPEAKKLKKRIRRRGPWELWSARETNVFFEAILEYGRDFDAINQHFATKYKKATDINKTKEQIRFFYYRACKKASKYITDCKDVNNKIFEVFCLANYAEFRKKGVTKIDDRRGQKLNELVHTGATLLKVKGKNIRLKTPACKALLKIHKVEEDNKEKEYEDQRQVKLPGYVTIELYPKNSAAWMEVQAISQNPRLRVKVKPSRRVCSVFEFLKDKWKSTRLRAKEKLDPKPEKTPQQELYMSAVEDCQFSYYELRVPPPPHRRDLSLDYYMEQVRSGSCIGSPTTHRGSKKKARSQSTAQEDTTSSKDEQATKTSSTYVQPREPCSALVEGEAIAMDVDMAAAFITNNTAPTEDNSGPSAEKDDEDTCEEFPVISSHVDARGNPLDAVDPPIDVLQIKQEPDELEPDPDPIQVAAASAPAFKAKDSNNYVVFGFTQTQTKSKAKTKVVQDPIADKDKSPWMLKLDEKINLLREGFNRRMAEQLLVGDLCLLMGNPEKVKLVYEWVAPAAMPDLLEMGNMTNLLRRLLHVASAEYSELKKPPIHILKEDKTASKEVQVNIISVNDIIQARGGSPAVNGKRGAPSTPKQSRRKSNPSTPTTPKSALLKSACVSSPLTNTLSGLSAQGSPTIHVRPPSTEPVNIAPSPFSPQSVAGGDGVFKMPTTVPVRSGRPIAPSPMSGEPKKYDPILRRKKVPRQRKMVLQRQIAPRQNPEIPQLLAASNLLNYTIVPNPTSTAQDNVSLKNIVVQPPGLPFLAHAPHMTASKPTVTMLDPRQFAQCRRIISTAAGTVTGNSDLTQNVMEDSSQDPLQKAMACITTTTATTIAPPPTLTVLDPMHLSSNVQCRRIIPAPDGAVTGDNQLTMMPQTVIDDSVQDTASLQNVMVNIATTTAANTEPSVTMATTGAITTATDLSTITPTTTTAAAAVDSELQPDTEAFVSMPTEDDLLGDSGEGAATTATSQENSNMSFTSMLTGLDVGNSNDGKMVTVTVIEPSTATATVTGNTSPMLSHSMLDISLPGPPEVDQSTNNMIDLALENSTQSFSGISVLLDSSTNDGAARLNQESLVAPTTFPSQQLSPPSKPSTLAPEYQWLNGEDFNLSSFLDASKDAANTPAHFLESSRDGASNFIASKDRTSSFIASKDGASNFIASKDTATSFIASKDSATSFIASKDTATSFIASKGGASNFSTPKDEAASFSASKDVAANFLDGNSKDSVSNFLNSKDSTSNFLHSKVDDSNFLESKDSASNFLQAKDNPSNFLASAKDSEVALLSSAASGGGKKPSASGSGLTGSGQQVLGILGENSRDSLGGRFDVDTHLQNMMNESSMDYMSKFADLVQQVKDSDTGNSDTKKS